MRTAMKDYDWKVNAISVEEHWICFKETLAKHIPKTSGLPSKPGRHLWMNAKALAQVKKKVHSFERYMETREGEDYTQHTPELEIRPGGLAEMLFKISRGH